MPPADPATRLQRSLLGGLVLVLGLQSMRFLFGSITWYLRDTVGVATLDLVPIALAPFVAGGLAALLVIFVRPRPLLFATVGILAVARVANQLLDDPAVDLWSSAVATAGFVASWGVLAVMGRGVTVDGLLLGLTFDSAIKGMSLSLDLAYQPGPGPLTAVVALAAAAVYLLWATPAPERRGVSWPGGLTLLLLGPFLFFEALVLQNQGWLSETAGIGGVQAQLVIALLNVAGLAAIRLGERSRMAGLVGLAAAVGALTAAESPAYGWLAVVGVPGAALAWSAMVPDSEHRRVAPAAVFAPLGLLVFLGFGLAYYLPLDLRLGFDQTQARLAGVVLLAVAGAAAMGLRPGVSRRSPSLLWGFGGAMLVLPVVGLLAAFTGRELPPPSAEPLRVMTYNIHSAFDISGRFDLEAIARVIEDTEASIVALQEVPRGRLISGVTDELTLLQRRLGFEHAAFFGTTDPTWGNAVLSRFPILGVDTAYLPQVGTPLRRGYLGVTVDVAGRELLVISTHLQHINDPAVHDQDPEADLYPVHREQIATILDEWAGVRPAVLMGDFNARPGWRQITELLAAGWVDAWAEAGIGDGFTSNSADPRYRIDYIFHTPDMRAVDAGVIRSDASDHFPVVADLVFD
jgi:endonuclease/exonuclease/phosphatase family metal-dependent hydrolase